MRVDGVLGKAILFSTLTVTKFGIAEQAVAIHDDLCTLGVQTATALFNQLESKIGRQVVFDDWSPALGLRRCKHVGSLRWNAET